MLTMPAQISTMPAATCVVGNSCRNTMPSTVTSSGAVPRINGYANERSPVRYAWARDVVGEMDGRRAGDELPRGRSGHAGEGQQHERANGRSRDDGRGVEHRVAAGRAFQHRVPARVQQSGTEYRQRDAERQFLR